MSYIPTDEITIRDVKLSDILASHRKWLEGNKQGKRADLSCANLGGADLRRADLSYANLRRADLSYAFLSGANLSGADLSGADLGGADLRRANLRYANLSRAFLSGANLSGADLSGTKHNEYTAFFSLQCPERGSFIGFKKCGNYIVELEITAEAKRSSATSRKCRCSEAQVISITCADGTDSGIDTVCSDYDSKFVYKVGEISKVANFDENRWEECSTGIHFFITREEAENYL